LWIDNTRIYAVYLDVGMRKGCSLKLALSFAKQYNTFV
jgi:hypothetical protein